MTSRQKEQEEIQGLFDLSRRAAVWMSQEDRGRADAFLELQKATGKGAGEEDEKKPSHLLKTKKMVKSKKLKNGNKEKPVWSCDYCQKEFSKPSLLKLHIPVHTGQKDHRCNLCDFSTSYKQNLQPHIRCHLKERPFKCQEPNCGAAFASSAGRINHQLVHNKNDKRFSCSSCSFKTHNKKCLTRHMKNIHSELKPYKCPHENCEHSAKQKGALDRHLKIHSLEKNQICPHRNCGFKTKWTSALKRHVEIHLNGEKRFKCHFCEYSSHHHGDLVIHIRRHTGETPFACQFCSYKSKSKGDLKKHMKTHSRNSVKKIPRN